MRRKFEELKATLQEFVDQNDHFAMAINASDIEILYAIKSLEAVEGESISDVFLTFPHPFKSAEGYLQDMVASIEAQVIATQEMQKSEKLPVWPSVPSELRNPRISIPERLKKAFDFVRSLMPKEEDHRVVVGLLPTTIKAPEEYAAMVGAILPRDGFEPWMRGLRVVLRDTKETPFLIPFLKQEKIPGVLIFEYFWNWKINSK